MQDDSQNLNDQQQSPSEQPVQPQDSILNKTFGEVLQNKEAQEKIMKSMHIGPEQFQQLLKSTEGNPITNMTVGQLFKSGFVQQAVKAQGGNMEQVAQQVQQEQTPNQVIDQQQDAGLGQDPSADEQELDPEQFKQLVESGQAQVVETDEVGNPTKIAVVQQQPQNQSFWDFFKGTIKEIIRGKP